jgi:integrase
MVRGPDHHLCEIGAAAGDPSSSAALRHTYITRLAKTASAPIVQKLARHSTPVLTAHYTHVDQAEGAAAVQALESGNGPA